MERGRRRCPRRGFLSAKIRDVLRLKYALRRSHQEISAKVQISHSTVGSYVRRAREAGVSWPLPDGLDDGRLEAVLYPPPPPSRVPPPEPDWARVHRELARHKGVTLQLLWLEYRETHPDGDRYSRFCDRYREWRARLDVVLRQVYRAGERAFVDYAGRTLEVTDRRTGEIREAKAFVGVLAASNYTFVDLTLSRSLPYWTASHARMVEFCGGVPELVVPDNEKAAVRRGTRYEPDVNRTYHELAVHYGTDRAQRRYQRLKWLAKLHLDATIEDLNFKAAHGLDRSLVLRLASGQWIRAPSTTTAGRRSARSRRSPRRG